MEILKINIKNVLFKLIFLYLYFNLLFFIDILFFLMLAFFTLN
jgi:hypothetical protein